VSVNNRRQVLTSAPPVVGVRFAAAEIESLRQVASVYAYDGEPWSLPRVVKQASKLAAILLSLPVPGSRHWSDPVARRKDRRRKAGLSHAGDRATHA
jgi:hypothetical protein